MIQKTIISQGSKRMERESMDGHCKTYQDLKKYRDQHILEHVSSNDALNRFHDFILKNVFDIALRSIIDEFGSPPCGYTWFVMGSAGRFEQAVISDQDHGLIYENANHESKLFFEALGKEITTGLHFVGYPYCEGNIMSSNPKWCKSIEAWEHQIKTWMESDTWESIRYLLMFYDARAVVGNKEDVTVLKGIVCNYIDDHPEFLQRLMDNTMHLKKAIGIFGQFIVKNHGPYTGSIHLKDTCFFPYINVMRLLSIKEKIMETSTLVRLSHLLTFPRYDEALVTFEENFKKLLEYRMMNHEEKKEYDDFHYLKISLLTPEQKKELKRIIKDGKRFHQYVQCVIRKGC
ncbi:CBS domain-containing protein [Aquibacillus albus]|uniref:CBS domain-containing protein n=2 Tax=Aquibacillus albus TaxID=1168171 RepID=A0ABS2N439_9BACI|nr:CBS domain-containing protein [Aquibacillus albus]